MKFAPQHFQSAVIFALHLFATSYAASRVSRRLHRRRYFLVYNRPSRLAQNGARDERRSLHKSAQRLGGARNDRAIGRIRAARRHARSRLQAAACILFA